MLGLLSTFLLGLLFGYVIRVITKHEASVGTLFVYRSDLNESPSLYLELLSIPDELVRKKYITLDINASNFASPK